MDLNKLHISVKKLDALLTERETGTTSWWIMLGNLVREINDTVFPTDTNDITTEKRSHDWIAFLYNHKTIWEAGKTEVEAVGKLVLRILAEKNL